MPHGKAVTLPVLRTNGAQTVRMCHADVDADRQKQGPQEQECRPGNDLVKKAAADLQVSHPCSGISDSAVYGIERFTEMSVRMQ